MQWLKLCLKFSLSFVIIGYMVYAGHLDLSVVRQGFMHQGAMLGGFVLVGWAGMVAYYRWNLLLRGQGIHLTFAQLLRYSFIGAFFNTAMPGAVSGDLVKVWYVIADRPKGEPRTPVLTTVLLDRVMGLFGLILIAAIALALNWSDVWAVPQMRYVAWLVLMLSGGVAVFFTYVSLSHLGPFAALRRVVEPWAQHKVIGPFVKLYDAFVGYRESPAQLWTALGCAMVTHFSIIWAVVFCAHSLGEAHISLFKYFLLVPIGLITTAIPITPAGLGVGHIAFAQLFRSAGSELGAEIFTLYITLSILWNLIGVIPYVTTVKRPTEAVSL